MRSGYSRAQIDHAIAQIKGEAKKGDKEPQTASKSKKSAKKSKSSKKSTKKDAKAESKEAPVEAKAESKPAKVEQKKPAKRKSPVDKSKPRHHQFMHKLYLLMFDLDAFLAEVDESEGVVSAFLFYFGTFFFILPLIMGGSLLYYGSFQSGGTESANVIMSLVTFFIGSVALFSVFTLAKLIELIPFHFMTKLLGSKHGFSATLQAFYYGMAPAVLFLWLLPLFPVYLIFLLYSFFVFYETLKRMHDFDRRQSIMSIVLGMLCWMIIMVVVVLTVDPLLTAVVSEFGGMGIILN